MQDYFFHRKVAHRVVRRNILVEHFDLKNKPCLDLLALNILNVIEFVPNLYAS